jgi:hypothetical protein
MGILVSPCPIRISGKCSVCLKNKIIRCRKNRIHLKIPNFVVFADFWLPFLLSICQPEQQCDVQS